MQLSIGLCLTLLALLPPPPTQINSIYMPSKEEGLNLGVPMGTDLFNLPEPGSAKVCQRNTG